MARKRSVTLDIIRGISALLIVLFHYTAYYNSYPGNESYQYDFGISVDWGYAAVVTFFMLSGYLVTPVLVKHNVVPRAYIAKKFKRLYPAYWVAMTVTSLVLLTMFAEQAVTIPQYLVNLTMVSPIFKVPFVDGVYWSMQYELIFCLICALLLFLRNDKALVRTLFVWMAVAVLLTVVPFKFLRFLRLVFISYHAYAFVGGMIISLYAMRRVGTTVLLSLLGFCAVLCTLNYGLMSAYMAFFAATCVLLTLVGRLDARLSGNNWAVRAISWVAMISYPLYLLHQMAGYSLLRHLHRLGICPMCALLLVVTVMMCAAWIIHHFVERRCK